MIVLYTNDIGTFFDQTLLGHIKNGKNSEALSILKNVDPCQLTSSLGTTLLHFASKYGNTKIATYLIDLGAAVDARNRFAETPLMFAVDGNQPDTVKLLLEAKADPFAPDISGQCALGKAFSNYNQYKCSSINDILKDSAVSIVDALLAKVTIESLKQSAYVSDKNFHSNCPLYYFISLQNADITRILLECGSPVDVKTCIYRETSLHLAVGHLDLENANLLLEYGAGVNVKRYDGLTPLAMLSIENDEDQSKALAILKVLIAAGAALIDRRARKIMVRTLLLRGNTEIVRTLLQNQLDLRFNHATDIMWGTALHYLVVNRHADVLQEVQDLELFMDVRSKNGLTMLHVAAMAGRVKTIEYLLDNGAEVNAEDIYGETPLSYAVTIDQPLEKYDSDFYNYLNSIEILLKNGAHPRLRSSLVGERSIEDKYMPFRKPVIAHLALLEASGQAIEESMQIQIASYPPFKMIFDSMKRQLGEMRETMIEESVTLLDFLIASDETISLYARNKKSIVTNLTKHVEENSLNSYYRRIMTNKFLIVSQLVEKRIKVAIAINEAFIQLYNISAYTVAEKIAYYLEDRELYT